MHACDAQEGKAGLRPCLPDMHRDHIMQRWCAASQQHSRSRHTAPPAQGCSQLPTHDPSHKQPSSSKEPENKKTAVEKRTIRSGGIGPLETARCLQTALPACPPNAPCVEPSHSAAQARSLQSQQQERSTVNRCCCPLLLPPRRRSCAASKSR